MDAILIVVTIVLLLGGMGASLGRFAGRNRRRVWSDVGRSVGLAESAESTSGSSWLLRLTMASGKQRVSFVDATGGTRITIESTETALSGIELRPEDFETAREKHGAGGEIETGDPAFDEAFYIGGSPADVHARLDAGLRPRLLALHEEFKDVASIRIARGRLCADVPQKPYEDSRPTLTAVLKRLLETAQQLPEHVDVVQRLALHARGAREPAVRLHNLQLLIREFPARALTRNALQAACEDPSPAVRVHAANALGDERRDVLFAIAEDESADDLSAATAVDALGDRLAPQRALAVLEGALRTRRFATARSCIEHLRRAAFREAVPCLTRATALDHEIAVDAVLALVAAGGASVEPFLIKILKRDASPLRVAAAEALGTIGSAEAVLALQEAAEWDVTDTELVRAARQAIVAIQERLVGASPGQLSMAADHAGELSLPAAQDGSVSLSSAEAAPVPSAKKKRRR
jgi:hypothetical protein